MLIPYTFKIGHAQYTVYRFNATGPTVGYCTPECRHIKVATTKHHKPREAQQIAETFWHEVTHAILHDMGNPLWRNETFVTEFSKRLNQVIHTAKLDQ